MAGRDSVHARNTNIVSELFSQLNELSDAISPRATSGVESEVGNLDYPSLTVYNRNIFHKDCIFMLLLQSRMFAQQALTRDPVNPVYIRAIIRAQ